MEKTIIESAKKFIGTMRQNVAVASKEKDLLFMASVVSNNGSVVVSFSTVTLETGSLKKDMHPAVYKAAEELFDLVSKKFSGFTSVQIMLTDEFDGEPEVFQSNRLVRITNLDA